MGVARWIGKILRKLKLGKKAAGAADDAINLIDDACEVLSKELDDGLAAADDVAGAGGWKLGSGKSAAKWERQTAERGWSPESISKAVSSGEMVPAINKATGNAATRYINPETGQSVVIDNVTGEVIHVGGAGFTYGPGSGDLP